MLFLRLQPIRERTNLRSQTETDWETVAYRESVLLYVMGNLVSQGNFLSSLSLTKVKILYHAFLCIIGQRYFPKRLAIRIVAGAWCCVSFFLVQIYCSTLTSHLTSPNQKPLVNSFFEIADTPGLILTIDKGLAVDQAFQVRGVLLSEWRVFY